MRGAKVEAGRPVGRWEMIVAWGRIVAIYVV